MRAILPHTGYYAPGAPFGCLGGPTNSRIHGILARSCATTALPVSISQTHAYLARRRELIRYAAFGAAGYPIGSGCVESANKLVVEARLKLAGMHWARANVNPMLALRTLVANDRWADDWPAIWTQPRRPRHPIHRPLRTPGPRPSSMANPPPTIPGGDPQPSVQNDDAHPSAARYLTPVAVARTIPAFSQAFGAASPRAPKSSWTVCGGLNFRPCQCVCC